MTFFARWARRVSVALVLAVAAVTVLSDAASARVIESRKSGVWTYQHFRGDIEWCGVKTNWPNDSMILTIRLMRNKLDFYFYNTDWNLQRNQKMRDTVFRFGRYSFYADSETLSNSRALFGTFRDGIRGFVNRFKRATRMKIEFPTDQSIGVNLKGSSRAMDRAINCWDRYLNY